MTHTEVYATAEEIQHLQAVLGAPVIYVGGMPPLDPQAEAHRLALAHGLPEIRGYYGCDLATGEFVST